MKYKNSNVIVKIALFCKKNILHLGVLAVLLLILIVNLTTDKQEKVAVLVAKSKLIAGQKISANDIDTAYLPKHVSIKGLLLDSDKSQIEDNFISNNLEIGDLILSHNVYKSETALASINLSSKENKIFYLSRENVAFMPSNIVPNTLISLYGTDQKMSKNEVIVDKVKVISVDNSLKSPEFIVIELTGPQALALTSALSNNWYIQLIVNP